MSTVPDPSLADEFRAHIYGRHSASLQELLNTMRAAPMPGKRFLFLSKPGEEWSLSRYADTLPLRPEVDWTHTFDDLEDAEWHVFCERWNAMFGERLEATRPASAAPSAEEAARRSVIERCPSVLAYANRRSIRAGESIDFFVSSDGGTPFEAQLVRLLSPDLGPAGPAFRAPHVDGPVNGVHPGTEQPIRIGSYGRIPGPIDLGDSFALAIRVFPTLKDSVSRTVAQVRGRGATVTLTNSPAGLVAEVESVDGRTSAASVRRLVEHEWTDVEVVVDLVAGTVAVASSVVDAPSLRRDASQRAESRLDLARGSFAASSVSLAASIGADGHHIVPSCFNGRFEDARLTDRTRSTHVEVARWDFSRGITTDGIVDVSGHGYHGTLVNMPTRGVRGSRWTGDSLTWMADPEGYAAVHFHEDDLADAGWSRTFTYDVPRELASGCYALRVAPADGSTPPFYVPFMVRPARGAPTTKAAFIVPTTTYATYANMHLRINAQFNELNQGRLIVLDSTDFLLMSRPDLGKSCYDTHTDGSPIVYSGMNRPVTNFRPFGRTYKFCQDLMFIDWFDAMSMDVDVVTDDDIDREGVEALRPYRAVMTGSHPEYMSRKFLDAMQQFLDEGGRLMYLGGNGFYQMAEIPESRPDMVEVRRPGQDSLWRVNHAEAASSTSGLPTGLWRNIGRPENAMVGVGFLTMGFDQCAPYRRSAASHDPRASWIFDGIADDELIGDFGVLAGGAAGYEIDRHDVTKGSPRHSLLIASSFGHSNMFAVTSGSVLDTLPNPSSPLDNLRADLVFFETGNGGAVFSVGSIAWCGSLSHDGYRNNVSRLTKNVLDRFVDPAPFDMPDVQ